MIFHRVKELVTSMIQHVILRFLGKIAEHRNGYLHFLTKSYKEFDDSIETHFITERGEKIPVYSNYRYCIKEGWRYFTSLNILDTLKQCSLLTDREQKSLQEFISNRTITKSIEEINSVAGNIFKKHDEHFLINDPTRHLYILKPSLNEINTAIRAQQTHHHLLFHKLKSFGVACSVENRNLLEIGYISGGYSLFGFERMGLNVFGIDNCYDGMEDNLRLLPQHIYGVTGGKVDFQYDDITQETAFKPQTFDFIYSSSVLEHIKDLKGAFGEMKRILKKDGLLIHGYGPFWAPSGGHALGILDSPWGHALLSPQDSDRYLHQLRPNEYEIASAWINNALNRVTISQMQNYLTEAGFDILMWQENACPKSQSDYLTSEIIHRVFNRHKDISLSDLITQTVFFVARPHS